MTHNPAVKRIAAFLLSQTRGISQAEAAMELEADPFGNAGVISLAHVAFNEARAEVHAERNREACGQFEKRLSDTLNRSKTFAEMSDDELASHGWAATRDATGRAVYWHPVQKTA